MPETDEIRRLARKLHTPEEKCYGTIFAAYPDGHNTVYDFCLQLWTRGGELTDSHGRFTLATPQTTEALTFLREIVNDSSAVHPACRQMDSVKSGLAFAAGEASTMVNWFGFASMAEAAADSTVKGKIGIAQVPHATGCRGSSLNIYWILSIMSGSVHKDIAWRFCGTVPVPGWTDFHSEGGTMPKPRDRRVGEPHHPLLPSLGRVAPAPGRCCGWKCGRR